MHCFREKHNIQADHGMEFLKCIQAKKPVYCYIINGKHSKDIMKKPNTAPIAAFVLMLALSSCSFAATMNVTISVNTAQDRHAISPYIYGSNQDLTGTENFTMRRQGGNRMTGYNWENNASHAGTDWNNSNDNFMTYAMGIPDNQANTPGISTTAFIDSCKKAGAYPLLTLQMAGFVSHDKNGTVAANEVAPSIRWKRVLPKKPTAFTTTPDTADTAVYMDEFINFLKQKYAPVSAQWFGGCDLDNEPALWPFTHPRIHPDTPLCQELIDKSVALASAVKTVDSRHEIFGPVTFGFSEMYGFASQNDWNSVKGTSAWFVDWYLDKMSQASQTAGKRLLDVFDLHWYSEATGNSIRITDNSAQSSSKPVALARIQAPRTLWDQHYVETSWIGQWYSAFLPLIPKLTQSIAAHYPGTKLSISEYNYGGEDHISGGIAMSDVLGIYGKYGVDYACYWQMYTTTNFTSAAFKLFRNYNGSNASFGATSVQATTSDSVRSSAYASVFPASDNELHLIVINKLYDTTMNASISIAGSVTYTSARVWGFDSASSTITEKLPAPAIANNSITLSVPRLSVFHVVLTSSASVIRQSNNSFGGLPKIRLMTKGKLRLVYDLGSSLPFRMDLYSLDGRLLGLYENLSGHGALDISHIHEKCLVSVIRSPQGAIQRSVLMAE
jgi:mannan endo-1,4-beta-mannosidase